MRAFVLKMSDIRRCPKRSWAVDHYQADGTCRCQADNDLRDAFARLLRRKGPR